MILTDRSGVKDKFNKCIMQQLPTVYRSLVGAYIEEYDPIGYDNATIRLSDGSVYKCRQWCDVIQPETAETVASYDSEFYKGKAAITCNRYGSGTVYYIGTVCEKILYNRAYDYGTSPGLLAEMTGWSDGKLVTMSECATMPDPDLIVMDNAYRLWFAVWNWDFIVKNSTTELSDAYTSFDMMKKVYNSDVIITRDELPDFNS
ncbi:MAG: beta-galactosidase trimerization domain-containing protein [Oscillospiraceae bacterium]